MVIQKLTKLHEQSLILVQALIGVISPNFRMIWITVNDTITVTIVLEQKNSEDFEEIEDLKSEFEALQNGTIDYQFEVLISDKDIAWPNRVSSIVVFKRRED